MRHGSTGTRYSVPAPSASHFDVRMSLVEALKRGYVIKMATGIDHTLPPLHYSITIMVKAVL
jgi:hypothetical protein